MRSLTLIKSDVGRGARGPWLSNHPHPSLPHLREPVRSMWGSPASHQIAPWKTRKLKPEESKESPGRLASTANTEVVEEATS